MKRIISITVVLLALLAPIGFAKEKTPELTFYIVRHGKTVLNSAHRVQGWSDGVLIPSGVEAVQSAGRGLKDISFQSAYTSDSGRAVETTDLILKENQKWKAKRVKKDKRLREINFGTYEGDLNENMWSDIANANNITVDEFKQKATPRLFADSVAALDKQRASGFGESIPAEDYATASRRLKKAIQDIAKREAKADASGNVLIVSHGLAICTMLDGLIDHFEMPAGGLKNASVTLLSYQNGRFQLKKLNDTSYLEQGRRASS
ncbi:phosphoglycerate mutase [Streptococcus equi subsp. zooepidemicus Sz16]|uniref:histidine phosphatase family protein n=1 Tax=Streptococcus equi TaxID=1336 RepID=UPI0005C2E665|nr:histidine phosphatase family protein [Streptococcus equi]KIS05015.1 phosphoglycerate mutase [Streptococcus equi subsp. zooepidemicus Sz16]KIS15639.1 phosphoglycerate mutase [Streptococcus equi subsp. zooepidemicus SzAM35]MDI5944248.1 histidine phosphatase family protein [Streptococcus equi subsp. zooepidemicus]VTP92390.1 phosphoglycerate mutase [Streptococcus equi subsp. zooepidemicus]HEK9994986.1 histidine phosphatase family protein [Streptococcus equi subsp. zooepidemicus]